MRRRSSVLLVLVLLAAACSDDAATETTVATTVVGTVTTTTVPVTVTEASTTTVAATTAPTTTTAPATTTTAVAAALASGSGCAVPGNTLSDGDWFGFIEGIASGVLTFDLACYFDGTQADVAAVEDGIALPLEFKPYIRNQNPKVFTVTVSTSATVEDFLLGTMAFNTWVASVPPDFGCDGGTGFRNCPVWLQIEGGVASLIYGMLPEWSGDDRGS